MTSIILLFALAQPESLPAPAAFDLSARVVELPGGVVELHSPIELRDRDDVVIEGNNTTLVYRGSPTVGVLQLARMNRATVRNLSIRIESPGVDAAVLVTNLPGPSPTGRISTANRIENVRVMRGSTPTAARRAFSVDSFALGGSDANNEMHTFVDCLSQSHTEAGFYISGTQAHKLIFERCYAFDWDQRPVDGWRFDRGTYATLRDCGATWANVDIRLGTNQSSFLCEGFNSEHGKQFLVSTGTDSEFPCTVRHLRWDGEPKPGVPVVDTRGPGPWVFESSFFDGLNGNPPTLRFSSWLAGDVWLTGVYLRQRGGTEPVVKVAYPASWSVRASGVWWQRIRADGMRERKPIKGNN